MVKKILICLLFLLFCFSSTSLAVNVEVDLDTNDAQDIAYGGTNATTAANARISLGLGPSSDVTFNSVTTGATALPSWIFRDSDCPGTDKEVGKLLYEYINGADGAENADFFIQAMQSGTEVTVLQFDESDDQLEVNKKIAFESIVVFEVQAVSVTTEADLSITKSMVVLTGDNDSESDTVNLQDGVTGQLLYLIAGTNIDSNDTVTVGFTETTCTNCGAVVFDKQGENWHGIYTGSTWTQVSMETGL